ncbi:hypothetical protein GOV06_04000 [Candidatus Woesearchaeota archaeon]|nr:hypothetical protein [Candidatus Woesearchaeota archaeon]
MTDIRVSLKKELKDKIDDIAKSFGISTSEYIRHLIIEEFKRSRKT